MMFSPSAAGSQAATLGAARLALLALLALGACAEAPIKPSSSSPLVAPPPTASAAIPAVKPRPIDLSKPPSHPIPYADLPHPVRPAEPEGKPYNPLPPPLTSGASDAGSSTLSPASLRPLSTLPGWAMEDHLAALKAFRDGCGVAKAVEWRAVCSRARASSASDDSAARQFFELNFMAEARAPQGLLTAYFAPEYPAAAEPDGVFSAPLRPMPADPASAAGRTRAEIDTDPAADALAFMKPEDLFFLQIQGAGVLVFADGRRMKATYIGDNGLSFTAIARPMLKAGYLSASNLSGDAIRAWLAEHRGPEAEAVMDLDERYIFFDLAPDDGREPAGAAGQPLTAGRALAVDPAYHRYGALYWIDADAPTLNGAVPTYRRLALALDTGAAIRGERRADLYLGRGDAAGREAGHVRHVLNLVRLVPTSPSTAPSTHETPSENPGPEARGG